MSILQTVATIAQDQDRLANEQKLESNKYLMIPKKVLSGANVLDAKQHWTNFEKYVNTQQRYNTLASRMELCDAFSNTLSGHAYWWFQTIHNDITNTYDLHLAFLKKINKWGDTERDFTRAQNKLAFNADTQTVQDFTHDLDLLATLIELQVLKLLANLKNCFHQKWNRSC